MRSRSVCFLIATLAAVGSAAEPPSQVPLRAAGGSVVALWQKAPNPSKPYIAQLFAPGEKPVPLLDDSLTPAAGRQAVRLSGAHYEGLGMRFAPAWANQGEFIGADAATPPATGGERVTPGDCCAVRCTIEGRPLTVLLLAHPANPQPGEWFTMSKPFCYLSATLHLKNEPFTLAKGQRWTLRYRLAVFSTPPDHTRLVNTAAAWKTSNSFPTTEPSTPVKP